LKNFSVKTRTIIRAGRIGCPASGIDGPGSVVICREKIDAVELASNHVDCAPREETEDCRVLDFPEGVLLPGLIDLHAHPANSDSVFRLTGACSLG
jgi:imidazolonepropionase-like amidohydrolase